MRPTLLFTLFCSLIFFSCKKEEPAAPDPDDPFNHEFQHHYLVDFTQVDSTEGSWTFTRRHEKDMVISVSFSEALLVINGSSYFIQDIQKVGQETYKYIFEVFGTTTSTFLNATIDFSNNTFLAYYHNYSKNSFTDDYLIRSYSGNLSELDPTGNPEQEFASFSGDYELTFDLDYVDDASDTIYTAIVPVLFMANGIVVDGTLYSSNGFHSNYRYWYEETDKISSYMTTESDYYVGNDSLYILDEFHLVNSGSTEIWTDREIYGTRL